MYNYGDITNIKGSEVPIVDIVTGGSPCQDLSVAGKRAGLAGERSGLFMEQIRLIKEMRDEYRRTNDDGRNVSPRYMVWENVAGAFSSNKGEDFRAVLEETAKVTDENAVIPEPPKGKWTPCGCILGDGWSIAWRIHDAQFWGVPQRRKRICLLADFNGHSAGKILFELRRETHDSHTKQTVMDTRKESRSEIQSESSCVSGNSESCGEKREGTSEDAEGCSHTASRAISFQERAGKPGGGKGILIQDERTGALSTLNNQPVCYGVNTKGNGDAKCLNPWDVQSKHIQPEDGVAESLYSGECRYGGGESYVLQNVNILNPSDSQGNQVADSNGIYPTLRGSGGAGYQQGYVLQNQEAMAMETFHCTSEIEKVQTLKARDYKDPQVVCFEPGAASRVGGHIYEDEVSGTVRANAGDNQQAIVYGICSDGSNSMKSSNPNSGIYEADTSRTLDLNGGNPACNQGGMAVVQGVDCYNLTTTGDVGRTMATAGGGLNEHIPCVIQGTYGLDTYNQTIDDEVAQPLRAADGGDTTPKVVQVAATSAEPTIVCLEGNGSRESHRGDGYKESETMYTLNTVEQHGVCHTYRKKGHPQNSEQGQGWEETDVNDTLNVYDNSENRTPTIIVEESTENRPIIERRVYDWHRCDTRMTELGDVCCTASAAWGTGGNNVPLVMENTVVFTQNQRDEVRDLNGIAVGLQAERGTHQQNYIMETYQEPILLESNQNHATVQTDGVSTALPASMGMGGGYVPMVVDTYQETTGALCASGYDKLGTQEAMNDMYVVQSSNWDGSQISPTLTANNANGAQRMPDKDNFNAVITYSVDCYNQTQSEEISKSLNSVATDADHVPCVYGVDSYNQSAEYEMQPTLRTNGGGDNSPKICTYKKKNNAGEYDDGVGTLKACGGDYGGGSETLVTTYQNVTGTICEAISKGTSNQIATEDQLVTPNSIVRRLTPLECERLQGFPIVRKVKFTEMTKDEYIAWNLAEGNIIADVNTGKVYSTRGPGGIKLDNPRELKGSNLKGYLVVSIRNGETKMQCRIHRIIWIAAHGIIPDGYVIDHINNDKADNRLENLQLLTPGENSTKARNDNLYKIHEDAGAAKITDEVHDFIQHLYSTTDLTCKQMANVFGISKSRIHQIIHDEAWTNIGEWIDENGKKHKNADSPRYKALGNSIALPFWQWLADRIVKQLKEDGVENPTMASLFSGIGGFELVFSRSGCEPIWNSEIESFPIAVTRVRFPNEEVN